jgi:acyl carrier protein
VAALWRFQANFATFPSSTGRRDFPLGRILRRRDVTEQEIETKVIKIVSEQMSVEKETITRDTSFTNDLNADSLDTVEMVMALEEEFDIQIPDDQAEKIHTVGQAVDMINKGLAAKG